MAWPHSHPHWQGVKTCKIFSAQKLRVYFSRTRSSSNEFIGYVDLSDFYKIWPKWSSDIVARKRVGLFKNLKYFYFDASLRVAKRKIFYWSTSKFIFSETNGKILKARHTSGHKIAPNTGANATKFFTLATKSWKLVAKLATRISNHTLPRDLVIFEDL